MKDNKDKNKLILSIVAVVLVIVLIAGGTFAWWTWNSANNTDVKFTIQSCGVMHRRCDFFIGENI